jgi:hypothetical protein
MSGRNLAMFALMMASGSSSETSVDSYKDNHLMLAAVRTCTLTDKHFNLRLSWTAGEHRTEESVISDTRSVTAVTHKNVYCIREMNSTK